LLGSFLKFWDILIYRSAAELRSEGTRTYAGYLWWIFEPLMSLAVYYIAFKYIFHRDTENFAVFLFSGIVVYRFFAGTVTRSAMSITRSHALMQQVYMHKSIFPISVVIVNLVKFCVTLMLVFIAVWVVGIPPTVSYLALPVLGLLIVLVTAGVSMICAAITPFFPDFQLILGTLMHLLIFLSGVFHDVSKLSPQLQGLLRLNPLAAIIEQFRMIMLYGQWPDWPLLIPAFLQGIIFVLIGWLLIHKFNKYFPKIS
jgi:lipopolysaccharide transport system permease protein